MDRMHGSLPPYSMLCNMFNILNIHWIKNSHTVSYVYRCLEGRIRNKFSLEHTRPLISGGITARAWVINIAFLHVFETDWKSPNSIHVEAGICGYSFFNHNGRDVLSIRIHFLLSSNPPPPVIAIPQVSAAFSTEWSVFLTLSINFTCTWHCIQCSPGRSAEMLLLPTRGSLQFELYTLTEHPREYSFIKVKNLSTRK